MTQYLVAILVAVLRAILPAAVQASQPTAEDSRKQTQLRDRLRRKVQRSWKSAMLVPIAVLLLPGCFTRTVYVSDGEPVRLRETVRSAKVWILDADGKAVPGEMDLPAGWYCLPDPGTEADAPPTEERP